MSARLLRPALITVNLLGAYYLGGQLIYENIDDQPDIEVTQPTDNGLRSVDMAAHLIDREIREHGWVANDPPFYPTALLDNMGAFQEGLIQALGRFSTELVDHVARSRGASRLDPDLERASGLLRFPGDVWLFKLDETWLPTVTSEEQFLEARDALTAFNQRLSQGQANFDPRADNLRVIVERIASDLSSQGSLIEGELRDAAFNPFDNGTDIAFYNTKGRLYAYYLMLRETQYDFQEVLEQRGLTFLWGRMLASLREAATLQPVFVSNGKPGALLPSHLAEQGFYLLRAKTQMLDVATVLAGGR
ncbi:MAG: DUF2333 family protein [Geminicoccaceae bacterium]